ncbi:hypothetical protein C0995_008077 [Termitomyces sp. Mi166|nr:hypothetical protein C0995_008077 [Termitomyces sp. Mi166\
MAKKKTKTAVSEPQKAHAIPSTTGFFPFARYTSVVGVHTTLLTFTALYLPRTTFLFELTKPVVDPELQTSRDRPQHPFLQELTISPVSTLICLCAGVFLLQGWWGGWMRDWFIDYSLQGSDEQKRLDKIAADKQRGSACRSILSYLRELLTIAGYLGPKNRLGNYICRLLCCIRRSSTFRCFAHEVRSSWSGQIVPNSINTILLSHVPQTCLLAFLLSLLIVFPPMYSLGRPAFFGNDSRTLVNRLTWARLFAEFR